MRIVFLLLFLWWWVKVCFDVRRCAFWRTLRYLVSSRDLCWIFWWFELIVVDGMCFWYWCIDIYFCYYCVWLVFGLLLWVCVLIAFFSFWIRRKFSLRFRFRFFFVIICLFWLNLLWYILYFDVVDWLFLLLWILWVWLCLLCCSRVVAFFVSFFGCSFLIY